MIGFPNLVRMLLVSWMILLPFATPSALAGEQHPLRCTAGQGRSEPELLKLLDALRTGNDFYRQLVKWRGAPSHCKGSVGKGESEGGSQLELSWPDGASFEQSFLLPETSIVRYSNPKGLPNADEVIAAVRNYAGQRGLHVDWASSYPQKEGGVRIMEYRDPDPGVNGIVRFAYDRQDRLVAVSLSLAL